MEHLAAVDGLHDVAEPFLIANLPPEYPMDLAPEIEALLQATPDELVVYLEDDSTGVQQSHDVYLITDPSAASIRAGIKEARVAGHRLVFILTNSRALSTEEAAALNREVAQTLARLAAAEGLTFRIGSRSDSTLRGHFPLEPLTLMDALAPHVGPYDGLIVTHAFLTEWRRITVNGVHMLRMAKDDGSIWYRPVHLTRFAQDRRFGYPTSNMAEYVAYKFAASGLGAVTADDVHHIGLDTIRRGGPTQVRQHLLAAENGRVITVDAVSHRDLQVFVLGLLLAEREGKQFLYRSAASLPPARVNMRDIPVLSGKAILGAERLPGNVLCLWGSIVELSNLQLETTLSKIPDLVPIAFNVTKVLQSDADREDTVTHVLEQTEAAFAAGQHVVVYTVPRTEYPPGRLSDAARAANQQQIAAALQDVYNRVHITPGVVVFKGGATSSTGLLSSGAKRVYVLGQVAPGIPIVKILSPDNERFPGAETLMILGPGNVGVPETYVEILEKLTTR